MYVNGELGDDVGIKFSNSIDSTSTGSGDDIITADVRNDDGIMGEKTYNRVGPWIMSNNVNSGSSSRITPSISMIWMSQEMITQRLKGW